MTLCKTCRLYAKHNLEGSSGVTDHRINTAGDFN